MKTKNYSVKVIGVASVLVINAENEAKAIEYATGELSKGDFEVVEMTIDRVVEKSQLASERRTANCIAEDPSEEDDE